MCDILLSYLWVRALICRNHECDTISGACNVCDILSKIGMCDRLKVKIQRVQYYNSEVYMCDRLKVETLQVWYTKFTENRCDKLKVDETT